jgi:hypothetical protein
MYQYDEYLLGVNKAEKNTTWKNHKKESHHVAKAIQRV